MVRRRFRRAVLAGVVTMVGLLGCQLIVPGDVPEYHCSGTDPGACPSGMVCNAETSFCVSATTIDEAGTDSPFRRDSGDARSDVDAGPVPGSLGTECARDIDCNDGLACAGSTILTTTVIPGGTLPVCTRPCCTSAECGVGFVCFGASTGGNYCVSVERAKRSAPGTKSGGETCAAATDCRSGVCAGRCDSDPDLECEGAAQCDGGTCRKRCSDTCCGDSTCSSGSLCRVTLIGNRKVWACSSPNPGTSLPAAPESTCEANEECKNENCAFGDVPTKRCTATCCNSADCNARGFPGDVCAYGFANVGDQLKWCFSKNTAGPAKVGETCQVNGDCATRYCDGESRKCHQVCCTNADCPDGHSCRPAPQGTPYLRCVADTP